MKQIQEQLIIELIAKNPNFNYNQARTWVELMWDDISTNYAKAAFTQLSDDRVAGIIRSWIEGHGERLHEFIAKNPLYKHLMDDDTIMH